MKDKITLQLIAADFKNTSYNTNCAIERAVKRQFRTSDCFEFVDVSEIKGVCYTHERYEIQTFDQDKAFASQHNFDKTVIREIILTKNANT